MKHTSSILLAILFVILSVFCSCNKQNRFKLKTDTEHITVTIKRFDLDFMAVNGTNSKLAISKLYLKYPTFFPYFVGSVLDTAYNDTIAITNLISKFNKDTAYQKVNTKVTETFRDISDIEQSVSDAYSSIHHYFPDKKLPELYFFVSGFNRSVLMGDNFIAFGTDFYLGSDYPPYKVISYKYLLNNMRREAMATDIVSATLFRMFKMNGTQDRLLDNMLFRGKVMYLLSVFMPQEKPESIMGYTDEQWKWCTKFEKGVWGTMIDQKDVFSTDVLLIKKYLNDAPFTAPISTESPGRLGTWIGLRIIQSYMENNKSVSLQELMGEINSQKILENSGYRP